MTLPESVYLAGPMRNQPRWGFDAFEAAEKDLISRGIKVTSPHRMDLDLGFDPDSHHFPQWFTVEGCVRRDIDAIIKSEAIVMLPKWTESTGAMAEYHVARWLDKKCYLYPHMLEFTTGLPKELEHVGEDILEEALRITSHERNNSYGPPDQDFSRTAKIWSALFGKEFTARDVALGMIALKLSRATWSEKRDHWTDIAGYARCGAIIDHV